MMKKILLGVAAGVLSMAASAGEHNSLMEFLHGTYNGGGLGHTTISHYCPDTSFTCNDQRDVSFKVYGGLRMTDYLGTEVGFMSFGRIRSLKGGGSTTPVSELSTRTNGFVLNIAPVFPLTPKASIIGRLGVARWHVEGNDGSTQIKESKTAPYLGAAINYKITDFIPSMWKPTLNTLAVEVAWDATTIHYLNADHWYNMITVGTSFEF